MLYATTSSLQSGLKHHFWNLASHLDSAAHQSVRYARPNMAAIASVGVFGYPIYYVVWSFLFPQDYENLLLRMVGCGITIPVLLVRLWPEPWERLLPYYWIGALLYCLPFFFTYMLLQNAQFTYEAGTQSIAWPLSHVMAVVFLVFLIDDGLLVGLMYVVGSIAAWLAFLLVSDGANYDAIQRDYLVPMPIFLFLLIGGSIYNRHKETIKQEMLRAVSSVGSNIAHELRTPLLGIRANAQGVARYLPALIDGYEKAKEGGLDLTPIRSRHMEALRDSLERIEAEADYSNTIIEMLLINAGSSSVVPEEFRSHSALACARQAVRRYPFGSESEQVLVHLAQDKDFVFRGSDLLLVHVLFNLIKNALYFIAEAGKGEIFISLEIEEGTGANRIVFLDTGRGIPPQVLPRIFDRFYTSMRNGRGSGIGLSFCKMVMDGFGGSIECQSNVDDFTRFILRFPGVDEDD